MKNINTIKEKLKNVYYPGFSKSIVDFEFVKNIELADDTATISLVITSSAVEVEASLREDIAKELASMGLKANVIDQQDICQSSQKPKSEKV